GVACGLAGPRTRVAGPKAGKPAGPGRAEIAVIVSTAAAAMTAPVSISRRRSGRCRGGRLESSGGPPGGWRAGMPSAGPSRPSQSRTGIRSWYSARQAAQPRRCRLTRAASAGPRAPTMYAPISPRHLAHAWLILLPSAPRVGLVRCAGSRAGPSARRLHHVPSGGAIPSGPGGPSVTRRTALVCVATATSRLAGPGGGTPGGGGVPGEGGAGETVGEVVALRLAGTLVQLERVQGLAVVGELGHAVGAVDGAERPGNTAGGTEGSASAGRHREPEAQATARAQDLAVRLLLGRVERLPGPVDQDGADSRQRASGDHDAR